MQLKSLLEKMIEVHASDVFIIAGLPLAYQASGSHVRTDTAPLTPADTQEYIETIYELAGRDLSLFTDSVNHDDDFSFAVPSVGRFRANIFRQRGSYGAVIRVIPFGLPDPDEMNIPESVMRLADLNRGLVLVTGPTGCGKSTTLACMLDRMNHKRTGHILTMEDPIEFVHKHGSCIVTQREIPTDIANYSEALRSAMRESPDVILLGEMRDAETIGTAINAAEMTQLVLSTLHTTSAADTIERMIDAFPANQQRQIRTQLSLVLQATVSQMLIPALDGTTIPVFEVMHMNTAIRNLVREEKTYQIDSVIASNGASACRPWTRRCSTPYARAKWRRTSRCSTRIIRKPSCAVSRRKACKDPSTACKTANALLQPQEGVFAALCNLSAERRMRKGPAEASPFAARFMNLLLTSCRPFHLRLRQLRLRPDRDPSGSR